MRAVSPTERIHKMYEKISRRFVCPECGSDEINELSMCVVAHPVTEWSYSGEPESFGDPEVDWDSDIPYLKLTMAPEPAPRTLECSQCCEQFELPKVIDSASV